MNEAAKRLAGEFDAEGAYAGVVVETLLGEDVQRPQVTPAQAAARHTVAPHGNAARAFQCLPRASYVLAEPLWRHLVNVLVEEALAGDLVTAPQHLRDDLRLMLRDPAENEERRLGAYIIEEIECGLRVPVNTALKSRPVIRSYDPADRAHMAVVLKDNS